MSYTIRTAPLLGLILLLGCATTPRSSGPLSPELRERNTASFDKVWSTIREKHWDPTLGGVDWEAARDELRPRVESAQTMTAARSVMRTLLARLHQSHFAIISGEAYADRDDNSSENASASKRPERERGVVDIDPRIIDGKAVVWRVRPNSSAAQAGVKPGWLITSIGGRAVSDRLLPSYAVYDLPREREIGQIATLTGALGGPIGERLQMEFLNETDEPRKLEIPFDKPIGKTTTFGNLPPMHVDFQAHRMDDGIGYITFSMFLDPGRIMPEFERAVREFMDSPGIILDLRGNPGGLGAMSMGMAGWFVRQPNQSLGHMITREGDFNFVVNPRAETFDGPLAILVDAMSMSTTEIMAGGLHDLGRARVFGTPTGGAALPSAIEVLPNGDRFQYAFANYLSASGKPLEGDGVAIDELAPLNRAALLSGSDPAIERAVAWIRVQKADRASARSGGNPLE